MNRPDGGSDGVDIEVLDEAAYRAAIPDLAALLVDAVDSGASVSFVAGLDLGRATAWWTDLVGAVASGEVVPFAARRDGRIIGVTLLIGSTRENSPHRAEIVKVLVHRSMRGRGIATALLEALQMEALARGRTLLVLDTVAGSPAERLYTRLGWQSIGSIPGFALDVHGRPEAASFMWKDLAAIDRQPRTTS